MKLVHWPLMGGLLHLVQREGDWTGPQPVQALLAVRITALPLSAVLMYPDYRALHSSLGPVVISATGDRCPTQGRLLMGGLGDGSPTISKMGGGFATKGLH